MTKLPIQQLPHAEGLPLPARATAGAAGYDLRAAVLEPITLPPGARALVPTGLVFALPEGWEGQIRPRSGLAVRHGITLVNSPGTLDADYRGELKLPVINLGDTPFTITRGERLAQLVFARFEAPELEPVAALEADTARGAGGFGSTGRS